MERRVQGVVEVCRTLDTPGRGEPQTTGEVIKVLFFCAQTHKFLARREVIKVLWGGGGEVGTCGIWNGETWCR